MFLNKTCPFLLSVYFYILFKAILVTTLENSLFCLDLCPTIWVCSDYEHFSFLPSYILATMHCILTNLTGHPGFVWHSGHLYFPPYQTGHLLSHYPVTSVLPSGICTSCLSGSSQSLISQKPSPPCRRAFSLDKVSHEQVTMPLFWGPIIPLEKTILIFHHSLLWRCFAPVGLWGFLCVGFSFNSGLCCSRSWSNLKLGIRAFIHFWKTLSYFCFKSYSRPCSFSDLGAPGKLVMSQYPSNYLWWMIFPSLHISLQTNFVNKCIGGKTTGISIYQTIFLSLSAAFFAYRPLAITPWIHSFN